MYQSFYKFRSFNQLFCNELIKVMILVELNGEREDREFIPQDISYFGNILFSR